MLAASPITRQTVGRTFIVAISVLGAVAACQLGVVVWAFVARSHSVPSRIVPLAAGQDAATGDGKNPGVPPTEKMDLETPLLSTDGAAAEAAANPQTPKLAPLVPNPPPVSDTDQSARYKEAVSQGKLLRERGDMSTALTRFQEASRMDQENPEAIYETAMTYEKMQLLDKAAEQWRRLFDKGETAGPYYTAAEARLNMVKQETLNNVVPPPPEIEEGIAPGKTLGLLPVALEEREDRAVAKHLTLKMPIKSRSNSRIDVRDLVIQVLFYETVDNQNVPVQTTANVSSRWITAPADWLDSNLETLEVDYQLPLPDTRAARRENRKYYGYLIRIYYKGDLQSSTGAPDKLVQQFPPEQKLQVEANKN